MSESAPRELRARDTRIIETREEITLLFGADTRDFAGESDPVIDSATQVILTPPAAKRLSRVLKDGIARHESIHGPVDPHARAGKRRDQSFDVKASVSPAVRISGTDDLISRIDAIGVHYGLEHSFKIFPGAILGDRVLLGFHRDELGHDAAGILLNTCRELAMPVRFQKIYRERVDEANILLFGFEENEKGGTCKAYLEFGGMFETIVKEYPQRTPSFLVHLGFKWDAVDNRKATLARYICYPDLSVNDMLVRIRDRFYSGKASGAFRTVSGIMEKAADAVAEPDKFLYVEVGEENNPRASYDINLYRANLTLEELYPILRDACRSWKIPPDSFHRLYDPMKKRIFGHVSGGVDREGQEFLTFYYGVKGSSR